MKWYLFCKPISTAKGKRTLYIWVSIDVLRIFLYMLYRNSFIATLWYEYWNSNKMNYCSVYENKFIYHISILNCDCIFKQWNKQKLSHIHSWFIIVQTKKPIVHESSIYSGNTKSASTFEWPNTNLFWFGTFEWKTFATTKQNKTRFLTSDSWNYVS